MKKRCAAGLLLLIVLIQTAGCCEALRFRFADASEGVRRKSAHTAYYEQLSRVELEYRMGKADVSPEEFKAFSLEQIADFTPEETGAASASMERLRAIVTQNGYRLPDPGEIVFIASTMADEMRTLGCTLGTDIYLYSGIVTELPEIELDLLLAHELFHCMMRSDAQFRSAMLAVLGFSADAEAPAFAPCVEQWRVHNPDDVAPGAHAVFNVNGEQRDCYLVPCFDRPFSDEEADPFTRIRPVLVPVENPEEMLEISQAADFREVMGRNTDYVISPEECLADNFALALVCGETDAYPSPQIIEAILEILKRS